MHPFDGAVTVRKKALSKLHEKAESQAAELRQEVRRLREHEGEQGRQLAAARRAIERLAAERTALEVCIWLDLTTTTTTTTIIVVHVVNSKRIIAISDDANIKLMQQRLICAYHKHSLPTLLNGLPGIRSPQWTQSPATSPTVPLQLQSGV